MLGGRGSRRKPAVLVTGAVILGAAAVGAYLLVKPQGLPADYNRCKRAVGLLLITPPYEADAEALDRLATELSTIDFDNVLRRLANARLVTALRAEAAGLRQRGPAARSARSFSAHGELADNCLDAYANN